MWTDLEIVSTYRQAADKNKQIGILAELTGKSKLQIIGILQAGGEKVDGRIVGGARGGKARAKKEAEIKSALDQPQPEPDPEATVADAAKAYEWLTIDGQMLQYLRRLEAQLKTAEEKEKPAIRVRMGEILSFLLEDG